MKALLFSTIVDSIAQSMIEEQKKSHLFGHISVVEIDLARFRVFVRNPNNLREKLKSYLIFAMNQSERVFKAVKNCDVLIIPGGNTFEHLLILQTIKNRKGESLFEAIKRKRDTDFLYIGSSAGSILATDSIEIAGFADSNNFGVTNLEGFGFYHKAIKPHFMLWVQKYYLFERFSDTHNVEVVCLFEDDYVILDTKKGTSEVVGGYTITPSHKAAVQVS